MYLPLPHQEQMSSSWFLASSQRVTYAFTGYSLPQQLHRYQMVIACPPLSIFRDAGCATYNPVDAAHDPLCSQALWTSQSANTLLTVPPLVNRALVNVPAAIAGIAEVLFLFSVVLVPHLFAGDRAVVLPRKWTAVLILAMWTPHLDLLSVTRSAERVKLQCGLRALPSPSSDRVRALSEPARPQSPCDASQRRDP